MIHQLLYNNKGKNYENILFISLLVSINALITSCLGPKNQDNQEKCNKFLEDYNNPMANKGIEATNKCNSSNDFLVTDGITTTAEIQDDNLNINSINFNTRINNIAAIKKKIRDSETGFDSCKQLTKEYMELVKKTTDNDDSVCKNVSITTFVAIGNAKKPGEDGYKKSLTDNKSKSQKVIDNLSNIRAAVKPIVGL